MASTIDNRPHFRPAPMPDGPINFLMIVRDHHAQSRMRHYASHACHPLISRSPQRRANQEPQHGSTPVTSRATCLRLLGYLAVSLPLPRKHVRDEQGADSVPNYLSNKHRTLRSRIVR